MGPVGMPGHRTAKTDSALKWDRRPSQLTRARGLDGLDGAPDGFIERCVQLFWRAKPRKRRSVDEDSWRSVHLDCVPKELILLDDLRCLSAFHATLVVGDFQSGHRLGELQ